MGEYTNELYMQLSRANRTANYAIGAGIRGVLLLYQFFHRLEKEGILKGGNVKSLKKFIAVTEGKYDIMNIPYAVSDAAPDGSISEEASSRIRKALDTAGIRYAILPDMNPDDHRMQVAVFSQDAQKFSAFYSGYLRAHLAGGEKKYADLLNFTDGSASIISFPDEAREAMESALAKLRVDWAPLPDLNLKDGEFQLSVANHNTDTVLRAYKLYQEGLLNRNGTLTRDARVMTEEDYKRTAKLTADEYVASSKKEILDKTRAYEKAADPEKKKILDKADGSVRIPDKYTFAAYVKNPDYAGISVDCESLVDTGSARAMMARYPNLFFCRIPGCAGTSEKLLVVPKARAYLIQDAAKPRFIVFVNKSGTPSVVGSDGAFQAVDAQFPTAEKLLARFDKTELMGSALKKAVPLSAVPFPAPVK